MPRLRGAKKELDEELPVIEELSSGGVEIDLGEEPETEVTIDLAPSVTPETPQPEPVEDDRLAQALEATRKAEELSRQHQRERDEAVRQAREREQELTRERSDREEAQYNSVLTALSAEQSALAKAKQEYSSAASVGDWDAASEAQAAMAAIAVHIDRLETGKQAFDTKRDAKPAPEVERVAPQPTDFETRISNLPDAAKTWLRKHPEFINDNSKTVTIGNVHAYLVDVKKVEAFSPAYFEQLDDEFGFAQPEPVTDKSPPQPQRRSIPVVLPVSREVPTANGQRPAKSSMTLTAEEREIARTSYTAPDMTNEQKELMYARNKAKLQKMRREGSYPMPERN